VNESTIERMLAISAALSKASAEQSIAESKADGSCVVYFVQEGGSGAIKIGATGNIKNRLDMLRVNSPHEMNLVASVPGDERLEKYLHTRFKDSNVRGEWFRPTSKLFECIEELKQGRFLLSDEERLLVKEGANTWAEPFAPRPNRKKIRRRPYPQRSKPMAGLLDDALDLRNTSEKPGQK
jgi:hypothetical protein